jgi:alpha-D-glucose phosphate-specific phosphoglucomutase
MIPKIKFGTDGWRGIIAEDFTFANVRFCAQAVAEYLRDKGMAPRGMVVGYDTRFASERFAAAVAEVFAGNDIRTHLCPKVAPTPVVSYGVTHEKAAGAVIITASHNPGQWNGFKIKSPDGSSAPTQVEAEVESRLPQIISQDRIKRLDLEEGLSKGIVRYLDPTPDYFDHIAKLVDLYSLRQSGLKITADSMFGAGSGYFKKILEGGKTEVTEINGERNPIFPGIQPEPIARHLAKLSATIRQNGSAVGLATDGDADRIGVVDEKGSPLTPLQIFALLALYFFEVRGERGPIVRTVTTTSMLDKLGKIYNVPVYETKVGFKHVAPVMMAENALIGGEESSGFGFRGHIPERDGILAGLFLLDLMNKLHKTPSQLIEHLYRKVGPHHYNRVDLEFPPADREKIIGRVAGKTPSEIGTLKVVKVNTADGFHFTLADGSWLLIRFSGTEPILRIYAEAASLEQANSMIAQGKKLLGV